MAGYHLEFIHLLLIRWNNLSLSSLKFKQKSGGKEFKKLNQSIICKDLKFIHKNREILFNDLSFEIKNKKFYYYNW